MSGQVIATLHVSVKIPSSRAKLIRVVSSVMMSGSTSLRTWVGIASLSQDVFSMNLIISIISSSVQGLNSARELLVGVGAGQYVG